LWLQEGLGVPPQPQEHFFVAFRTEATSTACVRAQTHPLCAQEGFGVPPQPHAQPAVI
jgi:hypothetical protein